MTNLELTQALRIALDEFLQAVNENTDKTKIVMLRAKVDGLVRELEQLDRKVA